MKGVMFNTDPFLDTTQQSRLCLHNGKVGLLWKSIEESELQRLVSIHSDPHGKISSVKVAEAWALNKDLPPRSKSSLSSKWSSIKNHAGLLSSTDYVGNSRMEPRNQILTSAANTPTVDNVNINNNNINNNTTNSGGERNDGNGGSPEGVEEQLP